jgi:hypothetical protein
VHRARSVFPLPVSPTSAVIADLVIAKDTFFNSGSTLREDRKPPQKPSNWRMG